MAADMNKEIEGSNGEVSGIKELSVTPVITSLFKPSADMLGQEIKSYLQEKLISWKERKRAENVSGHIQKVQKRIAQEEASKDANEETIAQAESFEDWVDGAKEVEPDGNPLAEMWQSLLYEILHKRRTNKLLIQKLKLLDAYHAEVLIALGERGTSFARDEKERFFLAKLEEHGLVQRTHYVIWYTLSAIIWLLASGFLVYRDVFRPSLPPNPVLLMSVTILCLLFVVFIQLYPFFQRRGLARWQPSWIGKELLSGRIGGRAESAG